MLFTIVTDGGCSINKKILHCPGAYAFLVFNGKPSNETLVAKNSDKVLDTTNNRMELTAAIYGISTLAVHAGIEGIETHDIDVVVRTDSRYLVDGFHEYLPEWVERGWRKSDGAPVKNQDLWKRLKEDSPEFKSVVFEWVKGHSNDEWNELADMMVRMHLNSAKQRVPILRMETTQLGPEDPILQDL